MKKTARYIALVCCSMAITGYAGAAEPALIEQASLKANEPQTAPSDQKKCNMYLGVEVRAWFPKVSGQETRSSRLDLREDLGHKSKELTTAMFTFAENSKWRGNYESYSLTGNKTTASPKSFGGQAYLAGEGLTSEKKLTYWQVNYLPAYRKGTAKNFSWLMGIKGYKLNSLVAGNGTGNQKTERTYNNIGPALGGYYEVRNKCYNYYIELSALPNFGKGYGYDAEIGYGQQLSPNAVLIGGYRWLTVYGEDNSDQLKLGLKGPFMELNYKL